VPILDKGRPGTSLRRAISMIRGSERQKTEGLFGFAAAPALSPYVFEII
jgi:hypothetical protein